MVVKRLSNGCRIAFEEAGAERIGYVDQTMAAVTVRVLGAIDVSVDGRAASLAPKPQLLIALLAAQRGRWVSTQTLIEELWAGEAIPPSAQKTLQGNVLRLRRSLGPDAIVARRGSYAINLDAVTVDAEQLGAAVALVRSYRATGKLNEALEAAQGGEALWRGSPYDGVDEIDVLLAERQRLTALRHSLLEFRIGAQIDLGRSHEVVPELEGIVASEPLREEFWALLVRAFHLSGRRTDALAAFGRARRVLATELGISPGPALRTLENAILSDAHPTATQTGSHRDTPAASGRSSRPATTAPAHSWLVADAALIDRTWAMGRSHPSDPFVGRKGELALARHRYASAQRGERRTIVIQGAAGIGKTRLLHEMLAAFADEGASVVLHARNEAHVRRAYGPIVDLVDQVTLLDPLAAAKFDEAFTVRLRRLQDLGRSTIAETVAAAPSSNPLLERRLTAEAVNRVMTAFARNSGPVVIAIEDVQWADLATLDVVQELATTTLPAPILLVLTHRNDRRTVPLAETLRELDRTGRTDRAQLGVLDDSELRELISGLAGYAVYDDDNLFDNIVARTDGNTLLVRELAKSMAAGAPEFPDSVRDLIDSYLAACSSEAAVLAEIGALLGRSFDSSLATAIADKRIRATITEGATMEDALAELCDANLIEMISPKTAMFVHDLFRDAVVARFRPHERSASHLAIIDELEARLSDDLDAFVHHSVEAGEPARAALRLSQRARRSLGSGLVEDAAADAEAALVWFAKDPGHALVHELETALLLADARGLGLHHDQAERELRQIIRRATELEDSSRRVVLAGAHRRIAKMRLTERKPFEADQELSIAAGLVGPDEPEDPAVVDEWIAVWIEAANLDYFAQHRVPWAVGAIDRIEATVRRRGSGSQKILTDRTRALTLQMDTRFTGPEEAIVLLRRQRAGAIELGDLPMTADATFGMGFTYLCRLDGRSAAALFDEATELHDRLGDRFWHTLAVAYAATSRRLRGDVDETELRTRAAISLASELPVRSYLAMMESNLLWCELRRMGAAAASPTELSRVPRSLLASMLDHLQHPSVAQVYPFIGFMVWPALFIASVEQRPDAVAALAETLIAPTTQQLPDTIDTIVRTLTVSPDDPSIETAFAWARSVNLL